MRHCLFTLVALIIIQPQLANAFNFDYRKQFIAVGLSHGGDQLAKTASKKLTTAGGFAVQYGLNFTGKHSLHYQLALGYKWDSLNASNGNASFSDLSTSYVILKKNGKNRYGGGIVLHLASEYEASFSGSSFTSEMAPAIGLLAQFDFISKQKSTLSFQYELLEYEPDNLYLTSSGQKINTLDASSLSFVYRFHFQ